MRRAAGLVLAVMAVVVVPSAPGRAAGTPSLTVAVRVTGTDLDPARTYGSPTVLVDPSNKLNLVAATVEMRTRVCRLFRSADGGRTWALLDSLPGPKEYPFCFHTSGSVTESPIAWGRDSRLYYALVGWDVGDGGTSNGNLSVIVARSDDLGDTWRSTVARDTRGFKDSAVETNRPVSGIAVDTTTGPDDIVYVAWRLNLAGKPARPAIAVSTDGARTFGPPIDVAADFFANPANITGTIPEDRKKPEHLAGFNPAATIDDKGRLYVLWERRTTGVTPAPQFAYYVSRVTDQGRSITVHEVFPETPNLAGGVLTWSPEGGADGTLHAVWHAKPGQTQGETDIYHRRSIDGGRTWGQPTKLNDDDPAALQSQFNPNVSIAPDGRVDVAWWDFRNDQGTYSNDVYYTYSTDNGLSWSRNVRISDRSINRKIGPWSNNFD
ncbi:MAG: hypothetical protein ACRD0M_09240, partial [Acidimicrobiales bacterium]